MRHNDAHGLGTGWGGGVIANDVPLQLIHAGEVLLSVLIVRDKYIMYSLAPKETKDIVKTKKLKIFNYHYFPLLKCNFSDNLQNLWTKHSSSKTVNGNMSR